MAAVVVRQLGKILAAVPAARTPALLHGGQSLHGSALRADICRIVSPREGGRGCVPLAAEGAYAPRAVTAAHGSLLPAFPVQEWASVPGRDQKNRLGRPSTSSGNRSSKASVHRQFRPRYQAPAHPPEECHRRLQSRPPRKTPLLSCQAVFPEAACNGWRQRKYTAPSGLV